MKRKSASLFRFLFYPQSRLSQKVVSGGVMMFSFRLIERMLLLFKVIILARLLAPRDFGLVGIGTLTISFLDTFTVSGFDDALIQYKNDIHKFLDTAWTFSVIRGVVLFCFLYISSGYIAKFFNVSDADKILKAAAVLLLLSGFTNIGIVYLEKELDYHKKFIYQLSGALADIIVSISFVLILRNVWALVAGLLAKNIARLTLSYVLHPYRPRLSFNAKYAIELFKFGKWVLGSAMIYFLALQGDDVFLGKVLGATALGFYQMAFYLSNMPALEVTHSISYVIFAAYSKLQGDIARLREGYMMTVRFVGFIAVPLSAGVFFMADNLTGAFLGEKWLPIVPVVRILAVSGLIRAITAISGSLFFAVGKPNKDFDFLAIKVIFIALTIYPLTKYLDIRGTAFSVLIGSLASVPLWLKYTRKIVNVKQFDYIRELLPSASAAVFMIMVIVLAQHLFVLNSIWKICGVIFVSVSTYLAGIFLFWRIFNAGPYKDLKFMLHSVVTRE